MKTCQDISPDLMIDGLLKGGEPDIYDKAINRNECYHLSNANHPHWIDGEWKTKFYDCCVHLPGQYGSPVTEYGT